MIENDKKYFYEYSDNNNIKNALTDIKILDNISKNIFDESIYSFLLYNFFMAVFSLLFI